MGRTTTINGMTDLFSLVHRRPALPTSHQPRDKIRTIYVYDEYEFFSDNSVDDLRTNKLKIMEALDITFRPDDKISIGIIDRIPMVRIDTHG